VWLITCHARKLALNHTPRDFGGMCKIFWQRQPRAKLGKPIQTACIHPTLSRTNHITRPVPRHSRRHWRVFHFWGHMGWGPSAGTAILDRNRVVTIYTLRMAVDLLRGFRCLTLKTRTREKGRLAFLSSAFSLNGIAF